MRIPLRHGDGLVAEDLFKNVEIASRHHELAGERMAQIMKVQVNKPSPLAGVQESRPDIHDVAAR